MVEDGGAAFEINSTQTRNLNFLNLIDYFCTKRIEIDPLIREETTNESS